MARRTVRNRTLEFGGLWTTLKLAALESYLPAYTRIFTTNPAARHLSTMYIDAFAGTGKIEYLPDDQEDLFAHQRGEYVQGSAARALAVTPPFNRYVFIESKPSRCSELEVLKEQYPERRDSIDVRNGDANQFLLNWSETTEWSRWRAVVVLDPFAMDVGWETIEALAKTQAVDLWWLFPCGAFNRLLTKASRPPQSWSDALTRACGTTAWQERFYRTEVHQGLFGEMESEEKISGFSEINSFLRERLQCVFAGVSKQPLYLVNSCNVPIFMLFFAASNPKGASTATRIANWIIEHSGNKNSHRMD